MDRAVALAAALALGAASQARAAPPVTLDEALELAARGNPDLAVARADARSAAADAVAGVAGVLPRLDLSYAVGRDRIGASSRPRIVVTGGVADVVPRTPATDQHSYLLNLRLAQPLFDWATFKEVQRSRFGLRAAERQYDEASLAVAFEVTRRFHEVVRAERTLAVLEKTATRSEELVARADALFAAGRAPKSETLQARVNLANDRIAIEGQRIQLAQARSALAQTLGRDGAEELAVVPPASLDAAAPDAPEPPPLEALLATARARRPALAAQAALVAAADAAASGARGGWFPTLSAEASYGRQGDEFYDGLGGEGVAGDPSRAYTAVTQLVLSWNLFEGRRTTALVRRAEASSDRARANRVRAEALVAKEVSDARSAAVALGREVALAADALTIATQGLALARERLDAGLASQLEVRDASLKLTQAELSLVQARIDHAVARADLARAVGGPY